MKVIYRDVNEIVLTIKQTGYLSVCSDKLSRVSLRPQW